MNLSKFRRQFNRHVEEVADVLGQYDDTARLIGYTQYILEGVLAATRAAGKFQSEVVITLYLIDFVKDCIGELSEKFAVGDLETINHHFAEINTLTADYLVTLQNTLKQNKLDRV